MSASERTWNVALRSVGAAELEVAIFDVIGQSFLGTGITSKDVLTKLRSAPNAKKISLRVNSVGGIVDEAKAMVNLLNERSANGVTIEATVDGIAASAASYLLTAASKVVMPANAFMMLHGVRGGIRGTAADIEAHAAMMRRLDVQLADAYSAASARRGVAKTKDDYLAEFAKGDLYLDADEAIAWGLADEKLGALKVAACLADVSDLENAPAALRSAIYVTASAASEPQTHPPARQPSTQPSPTRTHKMQKHEIQSAYPEAYAAILADGVAIERKRVTGHIKMGESCKAGAMALENIRSGVSVMDEDIFAAYQSVAINMRDRANYQSDSDAAGDVIANAMGGAGAPGSEAADGEPPLLALAADIYAGPSTKKVA